MMFFVPTLRMTSAEICWFPLPNIYPCPPITVTMIFALGYFLSADRISCSVQSEPMTWPRKRRSTPNRVLGFPI